MAIYKSTNKKNITNRTIERKALVFISFILFIIAAKLYFSFKVEFDTIQIAYKNGAAINLDKNFNTANLSAILKNGNYIEDDKDINFISTELKRKILSNQKNLQNLGAINKEAFKVNALLADSIGGENLKERVAISQLILGYDSIIIQLYTNPNSTLSSVVDCMNGNTSISAKVTKNTDKKLSFLEGQIYKIFPDRFIPPVSDVVVKLKEHFDLDNLKYSDSIRYDTIRYIDGGRMISLFDFKNNNISVIENFHIGKTDLFGNVIFKNLKDSSSYSIIPIKKGFEYGGSQGISNLTSNKEFTFKQKEHLIRLFSATTYSQIKGDQIITVRTPKQFIDDYFMWLILFFIAWWFLHIYWSISNINTDQLIVPILMFLSGICILIMYAISNPLTDTSKGNEMAFGSILGIIALGILSSKLNIVKWYNSKLFDFAGFRGKRFNQPGYLYILLAFGLTMLLLCFGSGPEGSGVKVNLSFIHLFSFQPSEITKYLIVIFFSAYFSKNSDYLRFLDNFNKKIRKILPVFFLIAGLLIFYLLVGDMGPALVLCTLFIIFFSVAWGDFKQLVLGVLLFFLLMFVGSKLGGGVKILLTTAFLWFLVWIMYSLISKKSIMSFENAISSFPSAIFMILVLSVFIFGEQIPNKVGDRLKQRNEIYNNAWENEVYGGDQIAHGIWAITSGGLTGRGIGQGNSNVMPANHTDMIMASIGEELGLIGLIIIIIFIAILLHRSLLIARKAAHPFVFYLCAGIAVVTGIQFMIITAGCLGLIPLTGISVPFLSFGKVSMIINLAAFGIVLSASTIKSNDLQKEKINENYDNIIAMGSLFYTICSIVIILFLFNYMVLNTNKFIVKQAITANIMGEPIVSINPRINILIDKLESGNIYDRDSILLATSDKQKIVDINEKLPIDGISDSIIKKLLYAKLKRYYPFGENMFFWLGDYNTRLLWGNNKSGFFAENRFLSELRGFTTNNNSDEEVIKKNASHYKYDKYCKPQKNKQFELSNYNYTQLIPLLKAGVNSRKVRKFNAVNRDIYLTVDARLQTAIQNSIIEQVDNGYNGYKANWRTSVVIINASNGELLTSAVYPLPNKETFKNLYELPISEQKLAINRINLNGIIFTESDLGSTFATAPGSTAKVMSGLAGLNKEGRRAANIEYNISKDEIIRHDEPTGITNMDKAITESSNIYFIRLINDYKLDNQLSSIYQAVGVGIDGKGIYNYTNSYSTKELYEIQQHWYTKVYNQNRQSYYNKDLPIKKQLYSEFSQLAWGQGKMTATPLAMARLTGAIANNGILKNTKCILKSPNQTNLRDTSIRITTSEYATTMLGFMHKQVATVKIINENDFGDINFAGKTGTPQRNVPGVDKNFDGWYMFTFYSQKTKSPIAVCIRIERCGASLNAVNLAKNIIIPTLKNLHYIN